MREILHYRYRQLQLNLVGTGKREWVWLSVEEAYAPTFKCINYLCC